jgi:hypothetical protein
MTIRFAGAKANRRSALAPWRCRSAPLCAANDNARAPLLHPPLVTALRHFARHGLASAELAAQRAAIAMGQGDRNASLDWLAVCRHFDRRMAEALELRWQA